jgi:hypothetical protein
MPSVIVKQPKEIEFNVKSDIDIIKKFDNIKVLMDNIKSRIFIHEFVGSQNNETYDYDLILN